MEIKRFFLAIWLVVAVTLGSIAIMYAAYDVSKRGEIKSEGVDIINSSLASPNLEEVCPKVSPTPTAPVTTKVETKKTFSAPVTPTALP